MSAIATRVRAAIKDRILDLAIPEIGIRVYGQMMPDDTDVAYPCVMLTQDGLTDTEVVRTSGYRLSGKSTRVLIADRHDQRFDHSALPNYELIRQTLEIAFDGQPLVGVDECVRCRIEELPLVDPNIRGYQRVMSGFLVVAVCKVVIPGV